MRRLFPGTGHDSALWPVLLLLLIVLVPSAGVVWMMRAAMQNERLAVRQRLSDAYQAQLEVAHRQIDERWQQQIVRLDAIAASQPPAMAFAECVASGACDSAVILDSDGRVAYPAPTPFVAAAAERNAADWSRAERMEFLENDPQGAAAAYKAIAAGAQDAGIAARARQAQARALLAAGDRDGAIAVLQAMRNSNTTTDEHGRQLAADAELRLLQLLDADSSEHAAVAESLSKRLLDYGGSQLPSDQRQFLMHGLASFGSIDARMLKAENLAAEFADSPHEPVAPDTIQPTEMADVFQFRSKSGRVITLLTTSSIRRTIDDVLAEQPFPAGVVVEAQGPSQAEHVSGDLAAESLAPTLPGWQLALELSDAATFDDTANERTAFFLWTGVVVVAITAALALLVARMLREQFRLTRLKNDLVATVSHELKTPLASIRLLVDTLLDAESSPGAPFGDAARAREYLELIARENSRLSRLIDNFLTFSRMERGKHRFDFQPTDGAEIADQAVAAVAERFDDVTDVLSVDVERPLHVVGDFDALVTVVVNLLDNAWKYSDQPRQISLVARRAGDRIEFSVTDDGLGLSPRAVRKVFDRFYQVNQHLSRSHDGCGLGLSIVKYIVEAHGGQVSVESRLGTGSTFSISLPAEMTLADKHTAHQPQPMLN